MWLVNAYFSGVELSWDAIIVVVIRVDSNGKAEQNSPLLHVLVLVEGVTAHVCALGVVMMKLQCQIEPFQS